MKILKMIQEGKITAEEGANLLAALRESRESSRQTAAQKVIAEANRLKAIVDAGMNIATQFVPEMGIEELTEAIKQSTMTGKIVDVIDEEDGEHVEIFIE